jgi:hypothetical protein
MTNPIAALELSFTEEELAELACLDAEAIGEQVMAKLTDFILDLEALNLNPEILMAALLQVYCDTACEHGDRTLYEEHLIAAAEEEWEERTVH